MTNPDETEDTDRFDAMIKAQQEHDNAMKSQPGAITLAELKERYGPLQLLSADQALTLYYAGKTSKMFCLQNTEDVWYGSIGYRIVDVVNRYRLRIPVPPDIQDVYGCDDANVIDNDEDE